MIIFKQKYSVKLFLLSLTVCFLFACQNKPTTSPDKIIVDDLNLQDINQQNNAIKMAISQLETGQTVEAEIIINQVLRVNQSHNTAKILKQQLTELAKTIFKTDRTIQYKIKSGDTLGSLAKTWLGNSIYFFTLAKLNKINNSNQIQPGHLIKIPVTSQSPLVKKEKRRSSANLALLESYLTENRLTKLLIRMTTIFILESDYKKLLKLQDKALNQLSNSKISISERQKMVNQIRTISSQSKRRVLKANFELFVQQQSSTILLDEFVLLFEANSYKNSALKLIEAKKIVAAEKITQNNDQTIEYDQTEKQLINKLHEQAILFRKDQQLQKAADSWEIILAIQPDNDLALKYYHRTNKLLERLNRL